MILNLHIDRIELEVPGRETLSREEIVAAIGNAFQERLNGHMVISSGHRNQLPVVALAHRVTESAVSRIPDGCRRVFTQGGRSC